MGVCASCAREKRRIKLRTVEFPSPDDPNCPSWLPWTPSEWLRYRGDWYTQLDDMLGTEHYLQKYFEADARVARAAEELNQACSGDAGSEGLSQFTSEAQARAWHHRVESWRASTRSELFDDGVPAPGNSEVRWLLYPPAVQRVAKDNASDGTISCELCSKCRDSFAAIHGKTRAPKARMPRFARANGLWHGPDPPEIEALSYAETKVIQRARLYVSVKRIFLNAQSYARTGRDEAPRYHERNVVAYPQNSDAVYRALGLLPEELGKTVLVQFVGGDRSRLKYEPTLTVDVARLRAAFTWLLSHNWQWMEATKFDHIGATTHASPQRPSACKPQEESTLGASLEKLLEKYKESIGNEERGVPAELLQGATRVDPANVAVHQQGPADAVAPDNDDEHGHPDEDAPLDASAGVLEGSGETLSGAQLWDSIMRQYHVIERCSEEMTLKKKTPANYAETVHAAVKALEQLAHSKIRRRLEDLPLNKWLIMRWLWG